MWSTVFQAILIAGLCLSGIASAGYVPPNQSPPDLSNWYPCDLWTGARPDNVPGPGPNPNGTATLSNKDHFYAMKPDRTGQVHSTNKPRDAQQVLREAFEEAHSASKFPFGLHENAAMEMLLSASADSTPKFEWEAECALVRLPLTYASSGPLADATVEVFVKRIKREANSKVRKQIWLLQGGPGGSSKPLEPQMALMDMRLNSPSNTDENWDIYTLDHRGVGRSTRLNCVGPQAETIGSDGGVTITNDEFFPCIEANKLHFGIDGLKAFTTTNAAKDLGTLIDAAQATYGYTNNHVYGISYGTMWASRYMQLFPTQATSVVIDGIVSTKGPPRKRLTFDQWDYFMNKVGYDFLAKCEKDSGCNGHLKLSEKKDVAAWAKGVIDGADECLKDTSIPISRKEAGSTVAAGVKMLMGYFLIVPAVRPYIVSLLYRFDRCNDQDKRALEYFFAATKNLIAKVDCQGLNCEILGANIGATELWRIEDPLPTYESETQMFADSQFATCGGCDYAIRFKDYDTYQRDQFFNNTPSVAFPILMLNGDLDAQTSKYSAREQVANIGTPAKTYVEIPGAVHYTLARSPTTDGGNCGFDIFISFLEDPNNIDKSCLDRLVPVDFEGVNKEQNKAVWGTEDPFNGDPQVPAPTGTPTNSPPPQRGDDDGTVSKTTLYVVIAVAGIIIISLGIVTLMMHNRGRRSGQMSQVQLDNAGYSLHQDQLG